VLQDARGFRVQFSPEDRATAQLAIGLRCAEDPKLKPAQKVRVTVELVTE
jgi:hypothetical protein